MCKNCMTHNPKLRREHVKSKVEGIKKAMEKAKGGHKQGEREAVAKKRGYYPQGHKNYGDVYEK